MSGDSVTNMCLIGHQKKLERKKNISPVSPDLNGMSSRDGIVN